MRADHDGADRDAGTEEGAGAGERPAAARERSDPWKVAFVALLVVALVCVVTWILLGSRLLVVRDVAVTGLDRVGRQEVVNAVDVPTGTPLIRVDLEAGADRVGGLSLVESATVSRGWPATLRVEVVERRPLLAVRVGEEYRLVDRDGVRIEDSATRPGTHPLVRVTGEVEGNDAVRAAAEIVESAPDSLLARIGLIDATDTDAIRIEITEGAVIEWGTAEATGDKSDILRVLLREHPPADGAVYDLSTPDLAIVR
ncbi:cell division protein FtsQ/DivIB [Nocardiopsis flavescens]|uniref:Cell division protein FtsQ n=1 Tax=Nocardiopsis flavescens TaxID=758803 RepID=A0A1M6EUW2_9ACTN|nr:FtsQ-type POTRA domain-containing protein [Nocardiopsis flavescens]SHI89235.1 cell division protein FtsQ [Nocardiopsis flavescens]